MSPTIQSGAIGPPIPLRDALEHYNLKQNQLIKGQTDAQELLELQEKTEDIADEFGIYIMWFGNYVGLYGRFNGVFRFK
tara:strand:+ start:3163 stop:3399 length:237 start_codon:yes stop_codon:yes gene_type:complete